MPRQNGKRKRSIFVNNPNNKRGQYRGNDPSVNRTDFSVGQVPRPIRNYQITLRKLNTVSSGVGGTITGGMQNDPSVCTDWTPCGSLFDCYRIDRMVVEWIPNLTYTTGILYPPLYVVFDPDSTTGPVTIDTALQFDNVRICDMAKTWNVAVNVPRITSAASLAGAFTVYEGGFIDNAAVAVNGGIFWYTANASSSQTYGNVVMHFFLTFANRR